MKRIIAITAANGRLGQAVCRILSSRHPSNVTFRFTARNPEKLGHVKGQVLRADFEDPISMKVAFTGVHTLLLISGMGSNEDRIRQHRTAIRCAVEAGVEHIVYTSFTHADPGSRFIWAQSQADAEKTLMTCGIPFTILRNNQYFANLDAFLERARETGIFSMPSLGGKVAFVSHSDLAEAIVEVLLGTGHENKVYDLTGPEAIDGRQIAAALGKGLDREVKAENCPLETMRGIMTGQGLPGFVVEGLLSLYEAAGAGEYGTVTEDLPMLLHRRPLSLLDQLATRTFPDLWATPLEAKPAPRHRRLPLPGMGTLARRGRHHGARH